MKCMNHIWKLAGASLATLLVLVPAVHAESSLEKALKSFNATTVQGYVQPLQDLFAANMTAGWYRSADIPPSGFNLSINIVGMGALLSDDLKSYDAATPEGFAQKTFNTATVFGKKEVTVVTDAATGLSYAGSGGSVDDLPIFPLVALQATIGHVQGTELIIRGFPVPEISGLPKITYWGIGGRHSVSQYFGEGEPPVHIAVGIFYNKITFGDYISVSSFYAGPQVSKTFSILELYGGFGYTKNSMDLNFTSTASGSQNVSVTFEGKDKVRGTVGAALNLGVVHLHGDLNFGSVTSISTSIGFGF